MSVRRDYFRDDYCYELYKESLECLFQPCGIIQDGGNWHSSRNYHSCTSYWSNISQWAGKAHGEMELCTWAKSRKVTESRTNAPLWTLQSSSFRLQRKTLHQYCPSGLKAGSFLSAANNNGIIAFQRYLDFKENFLVSNFLISVPCLHAWPIRACVNMNSLSHSMVTIFKKS